MKTFKPGLKEAQAEVYAEDLLELAEFKGVDYIGFHAPTHNLTTRLAHESDVDTAGMPQELVGKAIIFGHQDGYAVEPIDVPGMKVPWQVFAWVKQ